MSEPQLSEHISPVSKEWVRAVLAEHPLGPAGLALLVEAAAVRDRIETARQCVAANGLLLPSNANAIQNNPAVAAELDNRRLLVHLLQVLGLVK